MKESRDLDLSCTVLLLLFVLVGIPAGAQPSNTGTSGGTLRVVFDIPCGEDTRIRSVQSPWGVGRYQLKALWTPTSSPTTSEEQSPTDVTTLATWDSSDTTVGVVDSSGFFWGFTQGQTEVTATYQSVTSPVFTIVLPEPPPGGFPGLAGTSGCSQPAGQHDPGLAADVDVVVGALQDVISWPTDPLWPPNDPVSPPSWDIGDPLNRVQVSEEGGASGGAGAWDPNGVSHYPPGLTPDEDPGNDGSQIVYLSSNRGNAVVGVDLASSLRLRELVDANGALVFPPDLSFYDMLAAIWCGWCREEPGCTEGGVSCRHCDDDESDCLCDENWSGSQYPDNLGVCVSVGD